MNTQIEDIVKALKSAREERKALELRLSQITSTEVAIKQELVETYEYLGDFLEGIIKKPSFPKIHTATSIPAKAMEAKANEIIERIYSGTLYHKGRPLTKLDANLSSLASVDEFNSAFSWTHIKLIKINNLYISGDDLTSIIRSIFTVILKSKSLDRLKLLCKGADMIDGIELYTTNQ